MPRGAAARTDSKVKMDGCLSATEFGSAMAQRWKQAREKGDPVTLLLVDLDGLHELNVTHGRDEGDRAINASLAALAKNAKAERWTLGRVGGDEFALLAPGVATEAAFLRADAIRRELDSAMAKALRRGR